MVIDYHAHAVPDGVSAEAQTPDGKPLGWRTDDDSAWVHGKLRRFEGRSGQAWLGGPNVLLSDVSARLRWMAERHVDQQVLSIPPFIEAYGAEPGSGWRLSARMNDGLSQLAEEHGFLAYASVPLQDTDAAIAELRRAVQLPGIVGVQVLTNVGGVNLDDPRFSAFFAAVDRLGVPLFLHPDGPSDPARFSRYYMANCLGNPFETATAAVSLVLGGVLDRYRDLRLILSHGGGALPYLLGRVRQATKVARAAQTGTDLVDHALPRIYFDTVLHDAGALKYLIETFGPEQVVLGSDAPFDMGDDDPVGSLAAVDGLKEEVRGTILENRAPLVGTAACEA